MWGDESAWKNSSMPRQRESRLFELSRGIVTMVDVPNPWHFKLIDAIRRQLTAFGDKQPQLIFGIAGGGECKLLIPGLESERHPDLAVYKKPPPGGRNDDEVWSQWVPEIVIEVVSQSSRYRDYHQKPEEHLKLGVREYWIVDAEERLLKVLRRSRGRWVEVWFFPPPDTAPGCFPDSSSLSRQSIRPPDIDESQAIGETCPNRT